MAQGGDVILRFSDVSFGYGHLKPILNEASFSVRRGNKITLMGQNGAGKSTLFSLITREREPEEGLISINEKMSIAIAKQVIPYEDLDLSVREFFEKAFSEKIYDIDPRIAKALDAVNLKISDTSRKVRELSGGQQARLLLSFALIQNPDILLLDEPTNNLDKDGIEHLKNFLKEYKKTVIVISHDADFLNSFTDGVLYLDVFSRKVEQYAGNYFDVVREIEARIERERMTNARLQKDIENRKEQMGFFSQKGGHLRDVASKMREKIADLEENMVETRQEDKTIRQFVIPCQEEAAGDIIKFTSVPVLKNGKTTQKKIELSLKRKDKALLKGPNGIGKTTLLESIYSGKAKGIEVQSGIRIGYYRQDFSILDPEMTVYDSLASVMVGDGGEEQLRSAAAGFLITKEIVSSKIKMLSEGQKGLVSLARLVLQKPGLLLLDEPTNHINFRHLPIIAKALDKYDGAMILVSHMPEFVNQIKFTETIDLEKLK
ncbi:MAG: ABC-F family ATP-binding cassette domain-containing protein [Candidatus Colwellbacteria bacterium]|nr:ABC-F family ATP-binding cassette domain-containing protein [Candidatus Colwellbacteria bacterium]